MTVNDLSRLDAFTPIVLPDPDREINGVYIGDLLSWVMGRAEPGNAWITIMSNSNIIAVASLAEISCIILAEGVSLDADVIQTASDKGINVLSTDMTSYHTAIKINNRSNE